MSSDSDTATPAADDVNLARLAEEIESAEFEVTFRGYEPREVRSFLTELSGKLRSVAGAGLPGAVDFSAPAQLAPIVVPEGEGAVEVIASDLAQMMSAVRAQVDSFRQGAQREAESKLDEARRHAAQIVERAQAEADAKAAEAVAAAQREAEEHARSLEEQLARRRSEVEASERELERLRQEAEERGRERDGIDSEIAARRAEAEQEIHTMRSEVLRRADEEAAQTVSAAQASIRSVEEARTRAEVQLETLLRRAEEARRFADIELTTTRQELAAAREALQEVETRRREARRLWAQEWTGIRSHLSHVVELMARVGLSPDEGEDLSEVDRSEPAPYDAEADQQP